MRDLITRYNDGWGAHDLEAVAALHHPDIVYSSSATPRVLG